MKFPNSNTNVFESALFVKVVGKGMGYRNLHLDIEKPWALVPIFRIA